MSTTKMMCVFQLIVSFCTDNQLSNESVMSIREFPINLISSFLVLYCCCQHKYTALIFAAFKGHADVVEVLINAGAHVDDKTQYVRLAWILFQTLVISFSLCAGHVFFEASML